MDNSKIKVTIGIPTLNRCSYLILALKSALAQSYSNIEVVVSNNASTDGTATMLSAISDPRVKIMQQTKTLSMVDNWNACLTTATGTYFLLLSDDDILEPHAISRMVAAYEGSADPEKIGFVYCRGRFIDAKGQVLRLGQAAPASEDAANLILHFFQSKRDTWPCSILLRTADLDEGYSSNFALGTDAAIWIKSVVRRGSALFVNEELVNYRVHQNTTAATAISVWQRENLVLAEFAMDALRRAGEATPALLQEIEKAVRRLNIRIVPGLIHSSSGGQKIPAIRQYLKYWKDFASIYGVTVVVKSQLVLWLPTSITLGLRKLRERTLVQG